MRQHQGRAEMQNKDFSFSLIVLLNVLIFDKLTEINLGKELLNPDRSGLFARPGICCAILRIIKMVMVMVHTCSRKRSPSGANFPRGILEAKHSPP